MKPTTSSLTSIVKALPDGQQEFGAKGVAVLGDCHKLVERLPDGSVDAIVADPPSLPPVEGATARELAEPTLDWQALWPQLWRVLKPNGKIVLCYDDTRTKYATAGSQLEKAVAHARWLHKATNISAPKSNRPLSVVGEVLVLSQQPLPLAPDVPVIETPGSSLDQPRIGVAQKPVTLMQDVIREHTRPGDIVLDFVAGGFTTGVAAVLEDRRFVLFELNENHFKFGVERLNKLVAKPAHL